MTKLYIRIFKPLKKRAIILVSPRRIKSIDELEYGSGTDADDYFHEPEQMEKDGIIACANLKRTNINGHAAYYPYATYVHPDYRNKKIGILLYKTCLALVKYKILQLNPRSRPRFANHYKGEPGSGETSLEAMRVYKSLCKSGHLNQIEPGLYKIKQFPKIRYRIIQ